MPQTATHRVATLVAIALLLAGSLAGAGLAAADSHTDPTNRSADLAIDQPAYVDDEVRQTNINGTRAYVVTGEEFEVQPRNFRSENVVDYGLETGAGELSYDETMREYVFDPQGETGTFRLYWVVTRQTQVNQTSGNTTETVTRNISSRYTATVRVTGQTNLVHVSQADLDETRGAASNWRDLNATLNNLREDGLLFWLGDKPSNEEILQDAINTYVTKYDPPRGLLKDSGIVIAIVTTMFGLVLFGSYTGLFARIIRKLRKKLNIYESIEAEEGELKEEVIALDERERKQSLGNVDWYDWFDDWTADAFLELGETVEDGYTQLSNGALLPEVWIEDRLRAMDQCGYDLAVTRDSGEIASARVIDTETEPAHGEERVGIAEALDGDDGDAMLDAIPWTDPHLKRFDLVDADFDASECEVTPRTYDLEELLAHVQMQMDQFDDPETAGQYLREFVASVREHPYTDHDGAPQAPRQVLCRFQKAVQKMRDLHDVPIAEFQSQAIERALIDFDHGERAERELRDIQRGQFDA